MLRKSPSMPFQVGWDITHGCNYRCKHCYFTQEELSDYRFVPKDEAIRFIRYLGKKKVFHLSIAGGEPLLCPYLDDVIQEATVSGMVVALSTNASLIDQERADRLWDAGLRSLQISFEGSTAEINDSIRGRGSFQKTYEGTKVSIARGFEVLLAVVILRQNIDDVPRLCELAYELGASGVKVQTLIESGLAEDNSSDIQVPRHDLIPAIKRLWQIKREWEGKLRLLLPLIPEVVAEAKEAPEHFYQDASCHGCQPGYSTVRVNNVGDVRACGAQIRDSEFVGNVFDTELADIWLRSEELTRWRNEANLREGVSSSSCGSVCGKGCRASSAPRFAKTTVEGRSV